MAILTAEEAKAYLRVDSGFEDGLIGLLLRSAETLCRDVARLSAEEWEALSGYTEESTEGLSIRGETKTGAEALQMKELLRVGLLYTVGYLYEHREEADHHDLAMTLRNLLFSIREGVF